MLEYAPGDRVGLLDDGSEEPDFDLSSLATVPTPASTVSASENLTDGSIGGLDRPLRTGGSPLPEAPKSACTEVLSECKVGCFLSISYTTTRETASAFVNEGGDDDEGC